MPKSVRDANLATRNARSKLPFDRTSWRSITEGVHIGYRRTQRGGKWVARIYNGGGKYKVETVAPADDVIDADGAVVLNFHQAQERVRNLYIGNKREALGLRREVGPFTVADACREYATEFERTRKTGRGFRNTIEGRIIPDLGEIECEKLTAVKLSQWLEGLATSRPRARTTDRTASPTLRKSVDMEDEETQRRRKVTANRIWAVLRASLNHAFRTGKISTDVAWRRIRPFREVDKARVRYLSVAEAQRLTNAAAPDFRRLVQAALVTGCRYGELCALEVSDFHRDARTVHVRKSKAGKSRHVALTPEAAAMFASWTTGRAGSERMFLRANGEPWGPSDVWRPMADAVKAAKIEPRVVFHELRHTFASLAVMNGTPLMVVAKALGHKDTRMAEKHYAHLAEDFIKEAIRQGAATFGFKPDPKVARLERRTKK
ncbi:MAG TPA: site-specific integrase [Stellaceae bacterium]|nr:site-specific integrase [Stellaceae bacterium]